MRLKQANEAMLRRLEDLQSPAGDGTPHTFVFLGTTYPCSETSERVGLSAQWGGFDLVITHSLIVRVEALDGDPAPQAGHLVNLPDLDNQEERVVAAKLSSDGSHWTLDLAESTNQ